MKGPRAKRHECPRGQTTSRAPGPRDVTAPPVPSDMKDPQGDMQPRCPSGRTPLAILPEHHEVVLSDMSWGFCKSVSTWCCPRDGDMQPRVKFGQAPSRSIVPERPRMLLRRFVI